MKKYFILFIIILLFIILSLNFTFAAGYTLEIDYPDVEGVGPGRTLVEYIRYIYLFALGIVGLAAFGVIVWGGFQYMLSGANIVSQEEARKWITGAISGLVLALASYMILNTINPDLVKIKAPELEKLTAPTIQTTGPPAINLSTQQLGQNCVAGQAPYCISGLICVNGKCEADQQTQQNQASGKYRWEDTGSRDCGMFNKTNYNDNLCPQPKPCPNYECCGEYTNLDAYSQPPSCSQPTTLPSSTSQPQTEYTCAYTCQSIGKEIKGITDNCNDCINYGASQCKQFCGQDCVLSQQCQPYSGQKPACMVGNCPVSDCKKPCPTNETWNQTACMCL